GVMLYGRADDMTAAEVAYRGVDGRVAAFGAAGSKEYLSGMGVQDLCHAFAGGFNTEPGFPSVRINGGWIAELIGHIGQHGIQYCLVEGGGHCIVVVNSFLVVVGWFLIKSVENLVISAQTSRRCRLNGILFQPHTGRTFYARAEESVGMASFSNHIPDEPF